MDGMQMMMKALGVDPNAIMQAAGTFQAGLQKVMEDLETIKAQNALILELMNSNKKKLEVIERDSSAHEAMMRYAGESHG